MFQVSGQNIENFSRNLYFQVGGLHVRVLTLVCAPKMAKIDLFLVKFSDQRGGEVQPPQPSP